MAAPLALSNRQTRHLILSASGLCENHSDAAQLTEQLGYVQVDSIQWVDRAHDMVLGARSRGYRPKKLKRALEKDRTLFEAFTHDACVVPRAFLPQFKRHWQRHRSHLATKLGNWHGEEFLSLTKAVKDRIAHEGPLTAGEFDKNRKRSAQGWWDWGHEKSALEYLWRTGELAIERRTGSFAKHYEITERLYPEFSGLNVPDDHEMAHWTVAEALKRLGVANQGELRRFWDFLNVQECRTCCEPLQSATREGADGKHRAAYVAPNIEEQLSILKAPSGMRILSPFDPVVRDRKRLAEVWGYDYRIEIFVPEAKRKYGYYVFPLLDGDKFVGRIDLKAERADDALSVRRIWWEPGIEPISNARRSRLEKALVRVAHQAGLKHITGL